MVCDKRDGIHPQRLTFTGGERVGVQVFGRVWMPYTCVKTRAVTDMRVCTAREAGSGAEHTCSRHIVLK